MKSEFLKFICIYALIHIVRSYRLTNTVSGTRSHRLFSTSTPPEAKIGPRKQLFFEIVESGLADRFDSEIISKIYKFCQYAKNLIPAPVPQGFMHDPIEEYIDGLTSKPWWDPSSFEWVKGLEDQSAVITAELQSVLQQQEVFQGDSPAQRLMGVGWTAFRLQRLGNWNEENVGLFPETTRILRSLNIPFAVRGVMFAKQQPGSGVQAHSDGRNFILTAHLGLQIPEQPESCWISVAGEKRSWEKDKVMIFDTSFTHETDNTSDSDRYVLIVDFWHPELTAQEKEALEFIYDTRNKFETGKVRDIDCSYVKSGKPVTVDEYVKSKTGFGIAFANFFTGGGLVKFKK
jgi:hypothetical protein